MNKFNIGNRTDLIDFPFITNGGFRLLGMVLKKRK